MSALASHSPDDDEDEDAAAEHAHFLKVCASYAQYSVFQHSAFSGFQSRVSRLSAIQASLLPDSLVPGTTAHGRRGEQVNAAIERNQKFFDGILANAGQPMSGDYDFLAASKRLGALDPTSQIPPSPLPPPPFSSDDDMSKVNSVLKSCIRDWSSAGLPERQQCYSPILSAASQHVAPGSKILVPGAGLGRLALELASINGFRVQGNDFAMHMLLAGDFLLNRCDLGDNSFEISPYLSHSVNVNGRDDPFRVYSIPDVDPTKMIPPSDDPPSSEDSPSLPRFSFVAGEFLGIYTQPAELGAWDCVASCFFLDTAPYIGDYILAIRDLLPVGGILINIGPLLHHWSGPVLRPDEPDDWEGERRGGVDQRYYESVDLTWDDVRDMILKAGFEFLEERVGDKCNYTRDLRSFMHSEYECVFFVAQRKR